MRRVRFELPRVRGQGRPRFAGGHAYKQAADRQWEAEIAAAFLEAGGRPSRGPVRVFVGVHRRLPKGCPKGVESRPDTCRPDVDNVVKSVLDALSGHAYKDDAQVVEAWGVKHDRTRRDGDLTVVEVIQEEGRWP